MALDGAFLHCIAEELHPLIGTRIDKIYQPGRDELVLSFRGKGGAVRVLFSVSADAARVHITQTSPENPAQPPMFCMLLRKHLSGGKLEAIEQDGLERILRLKIRANNEMGDSILLTLVCEIMGRFSNVILVNEHGRIVDSLRRVDEDISADADVFAEVRVERQKHSEAFINGPPSDAAHVLTDFFHVMHARIELLGESLRLQRPSVHAVEGFRTSGKRFTLTEIFKQFFKFHIFLQEGAGAPFMPLPGNSGGS